MKKWGLAIGIVILVVGLVMFYNKLYYPALPIESISKKEVIEKLGDSNKPIVKLAEQNNFEWYIIDERNTTIANEIIKEYVSQYGWTFQRIEGSGIFFEKQGENLPVSTEKWTSRYILVQIPTKFND